MKSLQGKLLVASPHLPDPNFFRAVVLIIHHNQQGAFGLILNRPSQSTIAEIWNQLSDQPCDSRQPVHLGGPVKGPLMAVHREETCSENEILPEVYFAAQKENLDRIVHQKGRPFRLFSGYAGWGAGQLEGELKAGGWLTTPATLEYVFSDDDQKLWEKITRDIGGEILRSSLHIKDVPDDPAMN